MTRDTRKLQKVGGSTFSVSVPKEWALERGLSAGAPVTVYGHPGEPLEIRPGKPDPEEWAASVTVQHDDPLGVERTVRAAYAAGIDRLTLTAPDALDRSQRRRVGAVTDDLPGSAVLEERADALVVGVLLDAGEVSLEQSVRQLAFVARSMHKEAVDALDAAEETPTGRDGEARRLRALVDRHVHRGLTSLPELDALECSRAELDTYRGTARELERVADHARGLLALARSADVRLQDAPGAADGSDAHALPAAFPDLAADARAVVETATESITGDGGAPEARAALRARSDLHERIESLQGPALEEWSPAGARALDSLRRTADRGGAIAELGLRDGLYAERTAEDLGASATGPTPEVGED